MIFKWSSLNSFFFRSPTKCQMHFSHSMHALEHFTHFNTNSSQTKYNIKGIRHITPTPHTLPFIFLLCSALFRSEQAEPAVEQQHRNYYAKEASTDHLMNNTRHKKKKQKSTYSFNRLIKFCFMLVRFHVSALYLIRIVHCTANDVTHLSFYSTLDNENEIKTTYNTINCIGRGHFAHSIRIFELHHFQRTIFVIRY